MAHSLLAGKKGIISGALDQNSIAWSVAEKAYEQGATFTLTNAPIALRMGHLNELAEKCNTEVIPADASKPEDLDHLFTKSMEQLGGGIDFVLHAIGMSPNVRKSKPYTGTNYDYFKQTLDISALSLHKMLQTAWEKDALNEQASVLALSYIAAQRTFPDYNDMAEAKALLESIVRSFGYHYGKAKNVRVNSISQSPTMTTAGKGISGFQAFYDYADQMAPLGNASAEECADYCISMFSDYTKKVTMQNLDHDGGFSKVGISKEVMEQFQKGE